MADKEKEQKNGEEPKKKKPLLLFIILGLVLLLGAGGAGYFFFMAGPSDDELAAELEKEAAQPKAAVKKKQAVGVIVNLDPFIVNLADPKARHFLKTTITLEVADDDAKEEVNKVLPKIRNDIIMLLTSQTMADILTMEGKIRLRDQITARVERILGADRLLNIYFAQFVVQ